MIVWKAIKTCQDLARDFQGPLTSLFHIKRLPCGRTNSILEEKTSCYVTACMRGRDPDSESSAAV